MEKDTAKVMDKVMDKGSENKATQGTTRRSAIRRLNALAIGAVSATAITSFLPTRAEAASETLAESDPIAMALGYKIIATSVDTKKYPKRAGPEGATQFCVNCALFGNEAAGYGTCTAIPGKLVAAQGWCNAWIPKA